MNNGEVFPDVTSPDPLEEFSLFEEDEMLEDDVDSPASSEYSSYGESEFEKYCSANSFMGTASICSSLGTCNDFLDSDLGSFKNLRLDDDRLFETYGSGVRLGRNLIANGVHVEEDSVQSKNKTCSKSSPSNGSLTISEVKNGKYSRESSNMKASSSKNLYSEDTDEGLMSSIGYTELGFCRTFENGNSSLDVIGAEDEENDILNFGAQSHPSLGSSDSPLKVALLEENPTEKPQNYSGFFDQSGLISNDLSDCRESRRVIEGSSSKYEHSDDEDSMFGSGTDDEQRVDLYQRQKLQHSRVTKTDNGNPLLMNSTVAFGSEDWNDFINETGEDGLSLTLWDKPIEQQKGPIGNERKLMNMKDNCHTHGTDELVEDRESNSIGNVIIKKDKLTQNTLLNVNLNVLDGAAERDLQCLSDVGVTGIGESGISDNRSLGVAAFQLDPLSDIRLSTSNEEPRGNRTVEDHKPNLLPLLPQDDHDIGVERTEKESPLSLKLYPSPLIPSEVENPGSNESYDEFVLDMEEILLDSRESHGARFSQGNRSSSFQVPQPFRDGSSTASTSGTDDTYSVINQPLRIDGVEVVGAKQVKGDVSLGERIVGVKEYTVYRVKVWSGMDQWEVDRRYRDFYTLYRQLKRLFANHGSRLPSPWSRVEQESRKIFGNVSPGVVSERSSLIQECLRSILHSGSHYSMQTLISFLSPQKDNSSMVNTQVPQSSSEFSQGTSTEDFPSLGKTISLFVRIQPPKSIKQLLESQHHTCAECHQQLNSAKTLMGEFVHTLGWGKPRLCEYTGQLYCASCHTNDSAVLPARVLHLWDFTKYPVSHMAKSYLESIYDQPMLCVSAVNPILFSRVPTLLLVMGIRKKLGAMLPYLRCPFRRSINRGMGSRRHLLESNDFFALRDLVDLSKGAFAVLPVMLETVSEKILAHITQQCLVCCDVGVPCGARRACEDTSSLIFPFQESEVDKCASCEAVFHKTCFKKLNGCLCGAPSVGIKNFKVHSEKLESSTSAQLDEALEVSAKRLQSETSTGFFSSLFSRGKADKMWGSRKSSPVILMGSLPSTSL